MGFFKFSQWSWAHLKSSANQPVLPPGAPPVLLDGNTVAWYDSQDTNNITTDAFNRVSRWNDKLGSGHDLIQSSSTSGIRPILGKYGVQFNGVNSSMKTAAFTYTQPEMIYLVYKSTSWTNFDAILGGADRNVELLQRVATPGISLNENSKYVDAPGMVNRKIGIVRMLADNTNSKMTVNNGTPVLRLNNFQTTHMGLIALGSSSTPDNWANVEIKEAIFRNVKDSSINEQAIYDYLNTKYADQIAADKDGFDNAKFVLTFDDARSSVYDIAFPIMTARGIKSTIYVNGNDVGTAGRMTWAQLIEMYNAGHDIECHTFTHNTNITSESMLLSELNNNNAAFIANGLPSPRHFAYPGGVISDNLMTWIINSGLRDDARMTSNKFTNGFTNKSTYKWNWGTNITDTTTYANTQLIVNQAFTDKSAISTYIHEVGTSPGSLQMDVTIFTAMLDYALAQGVDFITVSQLYALMDH